MKNWTLRQRILASFAVIIAIMSLMVVASYSRLVSIESSQDKVRTDSIPGLFHSSMIRSAWVDSYIETLHLMSESVGRPLTKDEIALYKSFDERLEKELAGYRSTINGNDDESLYEAFMVLRNKYAQSLSTVLGLFEKNDMAEARRLLASSLTADWNAGRQQLNKIIQSNQDAAIKASINISDSVLAAKASMLISLLIAVIAAGLCGFLLMRAIMSPMQRIVSILEVMRSGDLSSRLNLERKDEFGAVETGFNDMMTELTALVSQAQRSSVQVTTSVTEIAATSKQQQAPLKRRRPPPKLVLLPARLQRPRVIWCAP